MKKILFAGLLFLVAACGATTTARPATTSSPRPPAPSCSAFEVAEWDNDGWECEPDINPRNGVDDEEDKKKAKKKATSTPSPRKVKP